MNTPAANEMRAIIAISHLFDALAHARRETGRNLSLSGTHEGGSAGAWRIIERLPTADPQTTQVRFIERPIDRDATSTERTASILRNLMTDAEERRTPSKDGGDRGYDSLAYPPAGLIVALPGWSS
jgi:hypothetical protein